MTTPKLFLLKIDQPVALTQTGTDGTYTHEPPYLVAWELGSATPRDIKPGAYVRIALFEIPAGKSEMFDGARHEVWRAEPADNFANDMEAMERCAGDEVFTTLSDFLRTAPRSTEFGGYAGVRPWVSNSGRKSLTGTRGKRATQTTVRLTEADIEFAKSMSNKVELSDGLRVLIESARKRKR